MHIDSHTSSITPYMDPTIDPKAMLAKGMKPVVVWLPETSELGVAEKLQQQLRRISFAESEKAILEWMEDNIDWPDDDSGFEA